MNNKQNLDQVFFEIRRKMKLMSSNITFEKLASLIESGELKDGFYSGIPNELYHSLDAIGSTEIKEFAKSPEHYLDYVNKTKKQTPAMLFGSLLHLAILEPEKFDKHVVSSDAARISAKMKDEAKQKGTFLIRQNDYEKIVAMRDRFFKEKSLLSLVKSDNTIIETSAFARYPHNKDILFRIRPDIYIQDKGLILDYKTVSRGLSEYQLQKHIVSMGYHIQAAFYVYVNKLITDNEFQFGWIFQEKESPYQVKAVLFEDQELDKTMELLHSILQQFNLAYQNNSFEEIEDKGLTSISLPPWYMPGEDING